MQSVGLRALPFDRHLLKSKKQKECSGDIQGYKNNGDVEI
jgi:hypothetical protein